VSTNRQGALQSESDDDGVVGARLGDKFDVICRHDADPYREAEESVRLELAPTIRAVVEVDGDELPREVRRSEADGNEPVRPAEANVDTSICERGHDARGEDREDRLDAVPKKEGSALYPCLLVILSILARVNRVVVNCPAGSRT
jgi:hypothetical protein